MSDTNAITKKRQGVMIGGLLTAIISLIVIGLFVYESDTGPKKSTSKKYERTNISQPGTVDDKEAWRAQEAAANKSNTDDIKQLKQQLVDLNELLRKEREDAAERQKQANLDLVETQQKEKFTSEEEATRRLKTDISVLDSPLPRSGMSHSSPSMEVGTLNSPIEPYRHSAMSDRAPDVFLVSATSGGNGADNISQFSAGKPEVLGFPVDESAKRYANPKGKKDGSFSAKTERSATFIPAGSFVRVTMLNGVDAPTGGQAQSNPIPITFHVLDAANLPGRRRLDIRDCRVVGVAWGDLSSERTVGRLETLSCVLNNGDTVEMPVKGAFIGEDGKFGIRGRLVTKQGQMLANAVLAGIAGGIGTAFQQSASIVNNSGIGTTSIVDPDQVKRAAIGGGMGSAGNLLAQYYIKNAEKLFPVIETDGGRVIELSITKSATYTGAADVFGDSRIRKSRATSRRNIDE